MDDVTTAQRVVWLLEGMTPVVEARAARRLNLLIGAVPLSEMSQAETDWVFEQKVRLAGD